ncbi:MAG: M23 family metallopeptidase [Betaproteobacteria bacterium]|nr:M23 family metallopeptidase [Betaproteobacteria bacterium]
MNIILLSGRTASTRTYNLSSRSLLVAGIFLLLALLAFGYALSWLSLYVHLPFMPQSAISAQEGKGGAQAQYSLDAMTTRLGEMQAHLLRLDSLGERISTMSGVNLQSPSPANSPAGAKDGAAAQKTGNEREGNGGIGGPFVRAAPQSPDDLQREIDRFAHELEQRSDRLFALESRLVDLYAISSRLPTMLPISNPRGISSGFGWRLDPYARMGAMHEGVDFPTDIGTRVKAAAGGVVTTAQYHPEYGNLIEIDHGNGYSTRYAHLSRIDVKAGQIVKIGQAIAFSGNSGRSTGPHLHFEVRFQGVPQNPVNFLQHRAPSLQVATLSASPPLESFSPNPPGAAAPAR